TPATTQNGLGIAEKIMPSTGRDREGLSNYVVTSLGFIDDKQEVRILFQGTRHCSLSPIAIEKEYTRLALASKNCRQLVADHALRGYEPYLNEFGSKDHPLALPITTMMLLTAKKGDAVRDRSKGIAGEWKGESETTQLEESAFALNQLHGRTISVKIG